MSEQLDWIAENEKIELSKELDRFIIKATAKNTSLMMAKIGGNITLNEHLIIQRTLQVAKACIDTIVKQEVTSEITIKGGLPLEQPKDNGGVVIDEWN
jgi:hypothetical protein